MIKNMMLFSLSLAASAHAMTDSIDLPQSIKDASTVTVILQKHWFSSDTETQIAITDTTTVAHVCHAGKNQLNALRTQKTDDQRRLTYTLTAQFYCNPTDDILSESQELPKNRFIKEMMKKYDTDIFVLCENQS